jgi:hypothetical protein
MMVCMQFLQPPAHALKGAKPIALASGAAFDGHRVQLEPAHLRAYAKVAEATLQHALRN